MTRITDLSRATDANGAPLSGAKLYFYATGTTTPIPVYSSPTLATSLGSVVTADAGGLFQNIYLDPSSVYRAVLKTSGGSTIWEIDPVDNGYSTGTATPEQFGMDVAAADNSSALSDAIDALDGRILDGGGKTYKLGSNIFKTMLVGVKMRNITFDCSSITGGGPALDIWGTSTNQRTLAADVAAGATVLTLDSTAGITAGGYVRITSNINIYAASSNKLGQMAKVLSVDSSTQITLCDPLLYSFTTAGATKVTGLVLVEGDHFENVKFLGANTGNQGALRLGYRLNPLLQSVSVDLFDYYGVDLSICWGAKVIGGHFSRAYAVGLAYGIVVEGGCRGTTIWGTTFEDVRHGVTIGGSTCTNTYTTVIGTHGYQIRNAGLDSHANSDFVTFIGNTVEMASNVAGALDGIISQSANFVCQGNTIIGVGGVLASGIRHQMLCDNVPIASSNVSNNTMLEIGGTASTDVGITIQHQGGSGVPMGPVVCNGNAIDGGLQIGIYIRSTSGPITDVSCNANAVHGATSAQSILIRAESASNVTRVACNDNVLHGAGTGQNILFLTDSTGVISNVMIGGNVLAAGNYGISFGGTNSNTIDKVEIGRNSYDNVTKLINWTSALNIVRVDRDGFPAVSVTNTTYTVGEADEFLTFDTSGTCTVTMPDPAKNPGRTLYCRNVQAQNIVSASSNVVPVDSKVAGTAILGNVAGKNTVLKSDGTNWVAFSA